MGASILVPDAVVRSGDSVTGVAVLVDGGRVAALGAQETLGDAPRRRLEGTLIPGVLDLQVNGAAGRGVDEATPEALDAVAAAVLAGGATRFLPTLISAPFERLLAQVRAVVQWISNAPTAGATPLGLHVEGPFLEVAGAHPPEALIDPSAERVDALLEAAAGHLRVVTLAPGRPGAVAATERLVEAGVCVSLGHAADAARVPDCVAAGARLVTHLYNAMSPLHHREPGMVGTVLDRPELTCSLIADGHHVHPIAMRLAWRALGPERLVLVTDSASPAGAPEGEYRLGDALVRSAGGVVRDVQGRLAGSAALAHDIAAVFWKTIPGATASDVAQVMASGPARLIGAASGIEVGAPARFGLVGADGALSALVF